MRTAEKSIVLFALLSVILRLFLVSGSSLMVVISLMSLGWVYMYLSFALFNDIRLRTIFRKSAYSNIPTLHIIGAIGSGFALAIACIAILFKFQLWRGAMMELMGAIIVCSIVLIISLIKMSKRHSSYYKRILTRIIILAGICLVLFFIPGKTFTEVLERDNPAYLQALEKARNDPDNKQLWDKANEEARKMHHH